MWPFAGLLTGVFALKLLIVLQLRDHPLLQPDAGLDTTAYVDLARMVLGGNVGLGPGPYYVSPLYIYFLSAGLAVTHSFTAVRLIQVVLGTASVGFIFLMARAWFGERAAWISAVLAGLTGLFTFYESLILQASIDAFMTSAALLALTLALTRQRLARRSPGAVGFAIAGIIFGVATLNRPNMGLAAAGIAAVMLATRRVRPAAALAVGVIVGLSPVAVRNVVVSGEWSGLTAGISSHGGLNFYIGNSETATGFYHQVPGITPTIAGQEKDARRVAERALGRPVTDRETSDYFFGLAWDWMRTHPGDALALFARKLGHTFSAQHVALPHSYPFYAYDSGTWLRFCVVGPWILVPLGLCGLVFAAPDARRSDYAIWVSFIPAYAVGVAAFFVAERYRLPLLVPMSVGAGAAVDHVVNALSTRRVDRLLAPGLIFAVLFAAVNWRHGLSDGRWDEGLRMAQRLVIVQRYDEANAWVRRLASNAPRPGAAEYGVGLQLMAANQVERAIVHLTRAQQLDPGQPTVEYGLGQALLKAGRAKDAIPHLQRGFDAGIAMPLGGYDLAIALESIGDLAGAVGVIRRIRPGDTDGGDPEAWLRLGRIASQARAPDVAEPFFRKAVDLRPEQASARQQFGLNLLVLGRHEEAARELAEAVRLDPRNPDTLSHLAFCEVKLGRVADARVHAQAALSFNPEDPLAKQLASALR